MGTPTRLSVAATAAILAACATPYKPHSEWNQGGYGEQLQAPGIYHVWFGGNHYTTEDRSEELAVLRAAELCLGESKPFMRISNFETASHLSVKTPGFTVMKSVPQAPTYGNPPSPVPRVVGYVPGGERYNTWSQLNVECLAERGEGAQEAAVAAATIRERYEIAAKPTTQASSR